MFFFEVVLGFDFRIALSKDLLEAIDNLNDLDSIELGADPNDETGYSPHRFSSSRELLEPPIRTPNGGRQAFSC
jgi:hypothetical protein